MHLRDTGAIVDARHEQALAAFGWSENHGYLRHAAWDPDLGKTRHKFLMHQKVWELEYGEPAPRSIDHINGNRKDNRVENLRRATPGLQAANKRTAKRDLPQGVYLSQGKYICAAVRHQGATHNLGTFQSPDDAAAAYREAQEAIIEYEAALARGEPADPPHIKKTTLPQARPRADRHAVAALWETGMEKRGIAKALGLCTRTVCTCLKDLGIYRPDKLGRKPKNNPGRSS